jgi:hypothetical protein
MDLVYVNNWVQGTTNKKRFTNFDGLLKARIGLLTARECKCEYLGVTFLAMLVEPPIGRRR